jgi:hypothetical protein
MRPAARYFAAGVVAVALGAAPALAQSQSTGSTSGSSQGTTGTQSGTSSTGTSTTGTTSPTQTTSPSSSTSSASSSAGIDEAAAREHLSQARQALADLTKLPAATQLQGDQRTQIANFIQAFNSFATATTDWRSKFQAVEQQLDQILASADASNTSSGTAGTTGSSTTANPSSGASTSGATGAGGTAAAGGYDPTIIAKLREVKTHLDGFQEASGDPTPHYDAIEKIIDSALNGASGSASVGTSGSTATSATGGDASASGSVTLTRAQLEEIRQHVEKLRAATNAAMAKQP